MERSGEGYAAQLPGHPERHHVRADRVAEQPGRDRTQIGRKDALERAAMARDMCRLRVRQIRLSRELPSGTICVFHNRGLPLQAPTGQGSWYRWHHEIATDERIGLASANAHWHLCSVPCWHQAHMARHPPPFCAKPNLIQHRNGTPIEVRRHSEHGTDGHDASAADTGDDEGGRSLEPVSRRRRRLTVFPRVSQPIAERRLLR